MAIICSNGSPSNGLYIEPIDVYYKGLYKNTRKNLEDGSPGYN
jgi:hypothetical protein